MAFRDSRPSFWSRPFGNLFGDRLRNAPRRKPRRRTRRLAFESCEARMMLAADPLIIDNGDPGYVESPGLEIAIDDGEPSMSISSLATDVTLDNAGGNYSESPAGDWHQSSLGGAIDGESRYSWEPSAVAAFHFSGIPDGVYELLATNPAHPNGTVATYAATSFAGSASFSVDQKPGGWRTLGDVTVGGGMLTVTVSQGDGSGVLRADAVRIVSKNGWQQSALGGHDGDSLYSKGGGDTATYSFTGLVAGEYVLEVNTPGHANSTSSATYTGGHAGGTATIGSIDQRPGTAGWVSVGTIAITGDTLDVTVSNTGTGILRTDALRLRRVDVWTDSNLGGYEGDSRYSAGSDAWAAYTFTGVESGA